MLKNANGAGVAFEAFQKLSFGLEQAGLSSDALQKGMLKMNQSMKMAKDGSKTAIADFKLLGTSIEELGKMSGEDRFRTIIDGLNKIEDSGERSALAAKILGKEFAGMNLGSSAGLDTAAAGMTTISTTAAQAAEAFNDSMNLIGTSFSNLIFNTIGPILPFITAAFDALSKFSAENPAMASILSGLALFLGGLLVVGAAVTIIGAPVVAAIAAIAAAIAGVVFVTNNWDEVVRVVTEFLASSFGVEVSAVSGFFQTLSEWVETAANWLSGAFSAGMDLAVSAIQTAMQYWGELFAAITALFNLDFAGFGSSMMNAFSIVVAFFRENFGTAISDTGIYLKEVMIFGLQSAADAFRNAMAGAIAFILGKLESGINSAINKLNELPGLAIPTIQGLADGIKTDYNTAGDRPTFGNSAVGSTYGGAIDAANGSLLPPRAPVAPTANPHGPVVQIVSPPVTESPLISTPSSSGGGGGSGGGAASAVDAASESLDGLTESATDAETAAKSFSENLTGSLASAFSQGLKTGDWKEALHGFLDTITNQIIDSFSQNLMDALFGDVFKDIFKGFGDSVQTGMETALGGAGEGGGWLSGLFGGGGGSGGGGGFFSSIFSGIGSFFGAADGGIVPTTPFSSSYRDSVPTMLMPGELVVPVGEVGNFQGGSNGSTFNVNITGDISRQTKKEIYSMMPELSRAVNEQNKEAGYR